MRAHRIVLGLDSDGTPIVEIKPSHRLLLAAPGSGKTTCSVLPMIMSLLGDFRIGMVVLDSKNGEIAAQCVPACLAAGRKVAVIDPTGVLPARLGRVSVNPLNCLSDVYRRERRKTGLISENINYSLIPEPPRGDDAKNYYWRASPRLILETVERALLKAHDGRVTPGMVWRSLATQSDALLEMIADAMDDDAADEALRSKAHQVGEMIDKTPEHWSQHLNAAVDSLRVFEAGGILDDVGEADEISHETLLREKYITFIVGDQRYVERLGVFYAMHIQSFMHAQMSGAMGHTEFCLDEGTNAPLQPFINGLTTLRGFEGFVAFSAQSRSEIVRKFGALQMQTLEENATTKQWFGFSSFEEAEKVSKAMGQRNTVHRTHSTAANDDRINTSYTHGKEPLMSVDELLRLKPDEQILHIKDFGWLRCKKVRQNMIAPYAFDLGDNPLEGAAMSPDVRVRLPVQAGYGGRYRAAGLQQSARRFGLWRR